MTTINYRERVLKVDGDTPKINEDAPFFSLKNSKGDTFDNKKIQGKKTIISVFPDINTSVCDLQTKRAYDLFKDRNDINILNVSNNTGEDLDKWCLLQDIDMEMLIDEDAKFAHNFGVWLPELEKLARSVFVIDENGKLVYYELVSEMTQEPDFNKALAYL